MNTEKYTPEEHEFVNHDIIKEAQISKFIQMKTTKDGEDLRANYVTAVELDKA